MKIYTYFKYRLNNEEIKEKKRQQLEKKSGQK